MINSKLLKALLLSSAVFALAACNKADNTTTDATQQPQVEQQAQDTTQAPADANQADASQADPAAANKFTTLEQARAPGATLGYPETANIYAILKLAKGQDELQPSAALYTKVLEQAALIANNSQEMQVFEQGISMFSNFEVKTVEDLAGLYSVMNHFDLVQRVAKDKTLEKLADDDSVTYEQFVEKVKQTLTETLGVVNPIIEELSSKGESYARAYQMVKLYTETATILEANDLVIKAQADVEKQKEAYLNRLKAVYALPGLIAAESYLDKAALVGANDGTNLASKDSIKMVKEFKKEFAEDIEDYVDDYVEKTGFPFFAKP